MLTCEVCAAEFKSKRGGKNAGRCCSRAYGFELQRRQRAANKVKTWQWRSIISYRPCDGCGKPITQGKRSKQVCNAACYRLVAGMTPRGSEVVGRCKCGGAITYTLTSMHRTHCDKCKRANAKARRRDYRAASRQSGTYIGSDHRKRARKYNVDYEPIQPRYIYERDNWTCHLCGERVHKSHPKDGYDPLGPSLDHIIPMSKGGAHIKSNVALAHFICNSIKSDGAVGEQLLLVG